MLGETAITIITHYLGSPKLLLSPIIAIITLSYHSIFVCPSLLLKYELVKSRELLLTE